MWSAKVMVDTEIKYLIMKSSPRLGKYISVLVSYLHNNTCSKTMYGFQKRVEHVIEKFSVHRTWVQTVGCDP